MSWRNTILTVGLFSTLSVAAQAGPAVTVTTPGDPFSGDFYTLGFEFTVNSSETIIALGVYDDLQDGLGHGASLGLWDGSGNLLRSATLGAGLTGTLIGDFRYADVAPFVLLPGNNYVVGTYLPGDFVTDFATSLFTGAGGSGSVDPNVNLIEDRYSNFDFAFSYPNVSDHHAGAWLGANFTDALVLDVDPVATPEPTSIALFGAGLAAIRLWRRRKPQRARA